nr:MAG TPA: hypothetical protein [Caudoviricetes sp.]
MPKKLNPVYSRQTRKKLYNKGMERRFFHGVQV